MKINSELISLIQFPDPLLSNDEGLVAVGGELSSEVILSAYLQGIFPWFNIEDPILWWSPNPRLIMFPKDFKCSKSLNKIVESNIFDIRIDYDFKSVIEACSKVTRNDQEGTWITQDIINAYEGLFKLGYAHSVECYRNGKLVGGLYGLCLGKVFCGESMFYYESNASKVAFYYLVAHLQKKGFELIDAQVPTEHLKSLGAKEFNRVEFINLLKKHINLDKRW
ncbi:leucyl/phenylalanyl-tRNA--protein transferase [Bacteroidales bacterium]|nr:leucyl/phenylalanyl-tRNA--protein transferase [Bacteroidales bacterium]